MAHSTISNRGSAMGHSRNSSSSSLITPMAHPPLNNNRGSVKGHSRNSSLSSLTTVKTSREETLDHDIYLLADRKGTFANEDKLSRLRNCIHYIYGANVIVKLLARRTQVKKSARTYEVRDSDTLSNSPSRRSSTVPATVDEIIAIERQGTVSTSKILYYA